MTINPPSPVAPVVTRFAPSPTGFLHIGGARTALFNYLFAKHHGGTMHLRIEDTDRARSTPEAIAAIIEGLQWLGLHWDGEIVYQFARASRHAEVAHALVATGHAYFCYASPQDLEAMRAEQKAQHQPQRYDGRWRDRDPKDAPADIKPVVRLKAPQTGATTINDLVQGAVTVENAVLDDMVLLRSDGTPTYMLSVVVDDNDMGVTHVIRGDDHLNNAFRQLQLIRAMAWAEPAYAHIPLIHGADGAKLSKRHGALAVGEYAKLGYLPEAMENALLRLGWGHGDDEIISRAEATEWFDTDHVGRAAARFDIKKLDNLNGHYMRAASDARLTHLVTPYVQEKIAACLTPNQQALIEKAMPELKPRAKNLLELADGTLFLVKTRPLTMDASAEKLLDGSGLGVLDEVATTLTAMEDWTLANLETALKALAERLGVGLGKIAQPVRAALTGSTTSPGIFDVLALLGSSESLGRISDALSNKQTLSA